MSVFGNTLYYTIQNLHSSLILICEFNVSFLLCLLTILCPCPLDKIVSLDVLFCFLITEGCLESPCGKNPEVISYNKLCDLQESLSDCHHPCLVFF